LTVESGEDALTATQILSFVTLAIILGGCSRGGDDCDPESFGRQCESEGAATYYTCGTRSCEDSPFASCEPRSKLMEHECPTHRPRCAQAETSDEPQIVCLGQEQADRCEELGFIACETENVVVECLEDGAGGMIRSRGECAEDEWCQEENDNWFGGCTDGVTNRKI
jgi:hypothetical protein